MPRTARAAAKVAAEDPHHVEVSQHEYDVAQWAASLRTAFLLCRELGHNWRPFTASWDGERSVFVRILRCTRCKSDRNQTLTRYGHVLTSSYDYPEGYLTDGLGRMVGEDRDRLRLESITRTLDTE